MSMKLYQDASPGDLGVPIKLFPQDPDALQGSYPYESAVLELKLLFTDFCPQRKLECIGKSHCMDVVIRAHSHLAQLLCTVLEHDCPCSSTAPACISIIYQMFSPQFFHLGQTLFSCQLVSTIKKLFASLTMKAPRAAKTET